MVLVAVGVKPNARLGVEAGLATGSKGALRGESADGNCDSGHLCRGRLRGNVAPSLNRYTYLPLGTTAHKQGRCAGENASGEVASLPAR